MKTVFICAESAIDDHVGEEYDEIIEVPDAPDSLIIKEWADRIRNRIRKAWNDDKKDESQEGEPVVEIHLAACGVYNSMLIDYQHVMKREEEIRIDLSYLDSTARTTTDPETQRMLDQLNK